MARFKVGTKVLLKKVDGDKLNKPVMAVITNNKVDSVWDCPEYRYEVKTCNHHRFGFNTAKSGTYWFVNGRDFEVI